MDIRPARLRWLSSVRPTVPVAESLGALPRSEPLDAVLIATPPESHCALGAEVLRGGTHLLVEKPLALQHGATILRVHDVKETRDVIAVWQASNEKTLRN